MSKKKNKKEEIDEAVADSKKENSNTKEKKENKKSKEQEYLEALQHTQAEFENYRKRVERDREQFTKYASEGLVKSLLPSLDNFERCLANLKEESYKEFVDGIKMVHDQIWKELSNAGVRRIDAEDQPFNPELHQPLLQEESDKPENTVIKVLEAGYKLNDKILRHARVVLSKGKNKD